MCASGPGSSTRRRFLRAGLGLAAAPIVAGCTEDVGEEFPENREWPTTELAPELPVRERADVVAEGVEATADATAREPDDLPDLVGEHAPEVDLRFVQRERDVLRVGYVDPERRSRGDLRTVGLLAGVYAALVDAGDDATALSVEILDPAPSSYGVATAESEWAERYLAGDLSAREYGELVAGTIASKRHSPEIDVSPDE